MTQRNLLVVDDEPDLGQLVCDVAAGLDYTAEAVESADAFEQRYRSDFDVVVLDLALPGTDGIELIRYLADNDSQSSIVLMSGCDLKVVRSASRLAEAYGLNVIGAVSKPIEIDTLERLLTQPAAATQAKAPAAPEPASLSEVARALARGEIKPHYQPKVCLSTGRVVGVEALARWDHDTRGVLSPEHFLQTAIDVGLIGAMTTAMTEQGLSDLRRWEREGLRVDSLAINFDAGCLADFDLPARVVNLLVRYGVSPDRLIVEVTESQAVSTLEAAIEILTRLRMRGIGLSVDDFGTGHSTMQQLEQYPFSELKVDRSFVSRITDNEHCAAIAKSIIDLGHKLELDVVAEGVETFQQLEILQQMGCDTVQGYLICRPLPAIEFEAWLARNRMSPMEQDGTDARPRLL